MTYFGFLAIFLGVPIVILSLLTIKDYQRDQWLPTSLGAIYPWVALTMLCFIAFIYTTPWDNYLVATGVWWYDIDLVSGIVFGYVPIEEYTFFVLQPIMTGLLLLSLMRYFKSESQPADSKRLRLIGGLIVFVIWLVSCIILGLTFTSPQWKPYTYVSLELAWALIPVILQMGFGADIIWRHRRVVILSIIISTLYLSFADSLAIGSGTWTIDPQQSLNLLIGGVLPIEEFIFFLLTNVLVVFGMTLLLAQESIERARNIALLRPLTRFRIIQSSQVERTAL